MPRDHAYYVYLLTNFARSVVYIGVTSDLEGRLYEHREGELASSFTKRYKVYRLVHCEQYSDVQAALAREKQLKGWTRAKKNALIEAENPRWDDLGAAWG